MDIVCWAQAIAPLSSTAGCIRTPWCCRHPSYNDDELNQYPGDFLSQSLFKILRGGLQAMSNAGNIHAAIRYCVFVINLVHNEGEDLLAWLRTLRQSKLVLRAACMLSMDRNINRAASIYMPSRLAMHFVPWTFESQALSSTKMRWSPTWQLPNRFLQLRQIPRLKRGLQTTASTRHSTSLYTVKSRSQL